MPALMSKQFIDGIYIPTGLLLVGVAIVKREWLPYAAALALFLGGWKFYNAGSRKVLKPNEFQNFELKEKTILSHNTAMYVFRELSISFLN